METKAWLIQVPNLTIGSLETLVWTTTVLARTKSEARAEAKKDFSAWCGCKRDRLPVGTVAYPIDLR